MKHIGGVTSPVQVQIPAFGISAFFSRHSPAFRMEDLVNSYHKIIIVVSGSGAAQVEDTHIALQRGAVFRIAPGIRHRFVDDPPSPLSLAILCIDPQALRSIPPQAWDAVTQALPTHSAHPARWLPGLAILEVQHLLGMITMQSARRRPHAFLSVAGLTAQVLAILLDDLGHQNQTSVSEGIASSILWINQHFAEPIRIADMADRIDLSYRTFTQQFHRATHMSVLQYITRLRMQFAIQCMRGSGDIMGSALSAGFTDLSNFYRIFKRHTGMTPREYLKSIQSSIISQATK